MAKILSLKAERIKRIKAVYAVEIAELTAELAEAERIQRKLIFILDNVTHPERGK